MDLVRLCPFTTATLLWEVGPSEWSLTVSVKATFTMVHGSEAVLAARQDPFDADCHWDDDPEASLSYAADLVPLKRRADVLLVGHAYAPAPTTSLVASLQVGELAKSIQVTGDRRWVRGPSGLVPGEPEPFDEMPLTYERVAFGPDNPVGIDANARPIEGALARPNLTDVFGPIDPTWRGRQGAMSLAGVDWAYEISTGRGDAGPPPHGFDFAFFNAAPPDQQVDLVRVSAPIVLENLHAEHARFETTLPGLRPKIFWADPSAKGPREIALRCDTLWIDTDSSVAIVTWRGVTAVTGPDESAIGRILAVAEAPGRRLRIEQVAELLRADDPSAIRIDELLGSGGHHPLDVRHDAVKSRESAVAVPEDEPTDAEDADAAPSIPAPPGDSTPAAETVSIERCAELTAELAERGGDRGAVLREHGFTESGWMAVEKRWADEMAAEASGGATALMDAYDAAYVSAQERFRSPIGVAQYARIVVGVDKREVGRVLDELKLTLPDVMRLQRVWSKRISLDPKIADEVAKAIEAARGS